MTLTDPSTTIAYDDLTPTGQAYQTAFADVYQANDAGHRAPHFNDVERLALEMNDTLKLDIDPRLISTVAWTHDLFSWSRTNHHELAAEWVLSTDHPLLSIFTEEERKDIAEACRTHRASYQGAFYSTLGDLMSSADRGRPTDLRQAIERTFLYCNRHLIASDEEALIRAVNHQHEKYGREGYARRPTIYRAFFKEELDGTYQEIDRLRLLPPCELFAYLFGSEPSQSK